MLNKETPTKDSETLRLIRTDETVSPPVLDSSLKKAFQCAFESNLQKQKELKEKKQLALYYINQPPPVGSRCFQEVFEKDTYRDIYYGYFVDNIHAEFRTGNPIDIKGFLFMKGVCLYPKIENIPPNTRVYRLGFKLGPVKDFDFISAGIVPTPSNCDLPYRVFIPSEYEIFIKIGVGALFNRFHNDYPLLLLEPEKYIVSIEHKDF